MITVKSFTDRHAHMQEYAASLGLDFTYVLDHDSDALSVADRESVSPALSDRSASNALKHMRAQHLLVEGGAEIALVLEDDVILFPEFMARLKALLSKLRQLESGWLIFLGGADNRIDRRFLEAGELDLIPAPLTTAEAYLIDRTGCIERLKWLKGNTISCQADHLLKQIDSEVGIKQYRLAVPIATQGSITGLFSTTLDESRRKHSKVFLHFRFGWNVFRRQYLPRLIFSGLRRWFRN